MHWLLTGLLGVVGFAVVVGIILLILFISGVKSLFKGAINTTGASDAMTCPIGYTRGLDKLGCVADEGITNAVCDADTHRYKDVASLPKYKNGCFTPEFAEGVKWIHPIDNL